MSNSLRLVADIGGTNSRLALFDSSSGELRHHRNYTNREHAEFTDIVAAWLADLEEAAPTECCLAIAAPPFDDQVTMLNMDWSFSLSELGQRFGFTRIAGINDFVGNAHSLPYLPAQDLITLHSGTVTPRSRLATVGPGTGLGGCTLDRSGPLPIAAHCEPGHMGLAPATNLELELFRTLVLEYGEVHAELLLCGSGLLRLYRALAEVEGWQAQNLEPADISGFAIAGTDDNCSHALRLYCGLLGSISGDFVLANGAFGGLYLAGGILPRMIEFLRTSNFHQRFIAKGKMAEHLERVPLYVITGGRAGLIGAAHFPLD